MKKAISNFFDSELDEADFFNLDKNSLISLREYIEFLKRQEISFQEAISDELLSIKDKCEWVENIKFWGLQFKTDDRFIVSSVKIDGLGTHLDMYYNKARDKYLPCPRQLPKALCLTKHARINKERAQSLELIQPEISSIDSIGQELFNGLIQRDSVSGKFEINYEPFEGVYLYNGLNTLAVYGDIRDRYRENDIYLNNEEQKEVLRKVLIKKEL